MEQLGKVHCNRCRRETNHTTLFEDERPDVDFDDFTEVNKVIQCSGCDKISFVNGIGYEDDKYCWSYYPEHQYDVYSFLSDDAMDSLPKMISDLYEEVTNAFKSDSAILAGIGLRTLTEAICIQQEIKGNNLQKKIQQLFQKGFISEAELPILDKLRMIGNISAHKIKSVSLDQLEYALGIINHVLQSIYFLPKLNKKIKV